MKVKFWWLPIWFHLVVFFSQLQKRFSRRRE